MASKKTHKAMDDRVANSTTGVWPSSAGNRPVLRQIKWHDLYHKVPLAPGASSTATGQSSHSSTRDCQVQHTLLLWYDEEQAQSENAERDLRSRSGQSLGSKGTKGSAGVRPAAATWK